ncbi:MAG: hypothetical protein LAO08_05525 [Acidobacteriia bacterium]|nr:hypothetical protein [Terriglobia bacterium]
MIDRKNPDEKAPESKKQKRPYKTPSLKFERVFEVSALACGKVFSTEGGCRVSRKAS